MIWPTQEGGALWPRIQGSSSQSSAIPTQTPCQRQFWRMSSGFTGTGALCTCLRALSSVRPHASRKAPSVLSPTWGGRARSSAGRTSTSCGASVLPWGKDKQVSRALCLHIQRAGPHIPKTI